jgi:hypothetical protein
MWTLVLVMFFNNQLLVEELGSHDTMYRCFDEREALSNKVGGKDGHFPEGMQAVCVYRGERL